MPFCRRWQSYRMKSRRVPDEATASTVEWIAARSRCPKRESSARASGHAADQRLNLDRDTFWRKHFKAISRGCHDN
jgi:hypothetical protein